MPARRDWLWLALICLASALPTEPVAGWLEYRRAAVLSGEFWRLASGHLVHFSPRHALQDGLALVLLTYALNRLDGTLPVWPRLALSAPLLGLFLAVTVPAMAVYRGASGLALVAAGMLLRTLWRKCPTWRPSLAAILALLCARMLGDALGWSVDLTDLPPGTRVAWQAHAAGLALGLWPARLSGRDAA